MSEVGFENWCLSPRPWLWKNWGEAQLKVRARLTDWRNEQHKRSFKTTRTETIVIGIPTKNNNFRYSLIEYSNTNNNISRILLASSLINVSKNVVLKRFINVRYKMTVIKKGKVLATNAPVTNINSSVPPFFKKKRAGWEWSKRTLLLDKRAL